MNAATAPLPAGFATVLIAVMLTVSIIGILRDWRRGR